MKDFVAAEDPEGNSAEGSPPRSDYCPVSDLPVLEDTDPTMPVLALTEEKEDPGYDPYDTGSFWATK